MPDIKFTPSELIGLYLLKGEAKAYKGSGLGGNIDSAFAKIGMFAPKGLAGKEDIIDRPTDAMLANQTCQISYHSFAAGRDKTFAIDSLHFFEHQGGLYLFVHTPKYGDIRVLAAELLNTIEPTGEKFTYPEDFDPDEKLKHAFGLFYDDPVEVEIRFAADQARYIRERIWVADQQVIDREDGSIIIEMNTSGRYEIKKWVLGYGAAAELLQPVDLRQEIQKELEQLYTLYN